MRETAYILQNITDKSFVIIDELGRGTSNQEGIGISFAICEKLLQKSAFTFFATHFRDLTIALDRYPNVVNLHLRVEVKYYYDKSQFNFLFVFLLTLPFFLYFVYTKYPIFL